MEYEKLNLNFDLGKNPNWELDSRYLQPKIKTEDELDEFVEYKYAEEFAKNIDLSKKTFAIVNGSFIFGDFIEALLIENAILCKEMQISTLSLSQENIDSLAGLMYQGYIEKLTIIGSDFFASHEKYNLMEYMKQVLDIDDRFQMIVARTHMKVCIFETSKGNKFVIQGSANLRSSSNYEQMTVEQNAELYDFIKAFHSELEKKYKVINHKVKKKLLAD
jgi:hypothetical protein